MDGDDLNRFPCSTCGSDLRYAPGTDLLKCDHCGAEEVIVGHRPFSIPAMAELDYRRAIQDGLSDFETDKVRTFSCENCGAHVEFDPAMHAAECPFCATPVVSGTGEERLIKPRAVLPFELDERSAREAMAKWLGSLWFAPNGLAEYARKGRKMDGIYVPYWTFDAETKTQYRGQRGTVYYVTQRIPVMVNGKRTMQTRKVPKVRWARVSGRVARFFDDVLVLASKSLPTSYTKALAPWDLSSLEPFQPAFLAGFRAEAYTITLEDGFGEAEAIMNRMIERDVKFDIGGDRQRITALNTQVGTLTFKHILLPIWVAAYKYRGQTYRFVVNAQSGSVKGERPYSAFKIAVAVGLGLMIATAIGYGLSAAEQSGYAVIQ
ncbi:MAG: primosomal protein N' (replication factor Y) - superfamily II helicase [Pseudomonadota bacterium]